MIPLPNFTTYDPITKKKLVRVGLLRTLTGILLAILYGWRNILFPPLYKDLDDKDFSPYLQIEKNIDTFFSIPAMEAVINSRWRQTKKYWMIPLIYYIVFLVLFSVLSWFYLSDINDKNKYYFLIMVVVFYYSGIYLLLIEIMQMIKYRGKYFTLFNMFDLCSIILGIIIFSIILANSFSKINGLNYEWMIFSTSVTAFLLWIEMVCLNVFSYHVQIFKLILYINLLFSLFFSSFYGYDYFQG